MVSRRKILSRSRDDLNLDQAYLQQQQEEEEDVWYQKDKLFKVSVERGSYNRDQSLKLSSIPMESFSALIFFVVDECSPPPLY